MQWFENEDYWQSFYPSMFSERRFQAAPEEVDRLLTLSGVSQGAVLDLCCGPARHALLLAQKGFQVTGVDRSAFLLTKARERAAGVSIELIQSDARDFLRPGAFDLALSLFTSFGYFETREEDLELLRTIHKNLKPGGVLVIDVMGRECVAAMPCRARWEESADGEIFVQYAEILPGWTRVRTRWLLTRGDHARQFAFELNLYSGQELSAALKTVGFHDVQLFGSLAGTPYDVTATRLVARAVAV
jgi:SAM-dependent methyltransferase